MEAVKLFGKDTCHKTRFYSQWLKDHSVPFDFFELEEHPSNRKLLSF